jgi:hypothetical protein
MTDEFFFCPLSSVLRRPVTARRSARRSANPALAVYVGDPLKVVGELHPLLLEPQEPAGAGWWARALAVSSAHSVALSRQSSTLGFTARVLHWIASFG